MLAQLERSDSVKHGETQPWLAGGRAGLQLLHGKFFSQEPEGRDVPAPPPRMHSFLHPHLPSTHIGQGGGDTHGSNNFVRFGGFCENKDLNF